MSFSFKTTRVADPANVEPEAAEIRKNSRIRNSDRSSSETPESNIRRNSNIRNGDGSSSGTPQSHIRRNSNNSSSGDIKKQHQSINSDNENQNSGNVANPAIPANRKRLFEMCAQATDGLKLPDGRRVTPAMFVKRLTADDIDGILCGDYGVPLLRCAVESMALFLREFDPEKK